MGLLALKPSSTIVNPDPNYSYPSVQWTNPGNARDSNSGTSASFTNIATFCGFRMVTPAFLSAGESVLVGAEVDFDFTITVGSGATAGFRMFWQLTPGTAFETTDLVPAGGGTKARSTQRFMLQPKNRKAYGTVVYLTPQWYDVVPGTTNMSGNIYEVTLLYADRGVITVMGG